MTNSHLDTVNGAEVCTPQAHPLTFDCPPRQSNRRQSALFDRIAAVSTAVCLSLGLTLGMSSFPAFAQDAIDPPPSTEKEIIDQIIKEQMRFDPDSAAANKHFCQIVLVSDGQLHEVPGISRLSSKGAGGRPGVAQITATNSSFRVSIDQPLGFTNAPADGNSGVIFNASYIGYGASGFSETPGGIEQKIKRGMTTIEAHLVADRTGTPFPAGHYATQLTLRCE